MNILKLNLDEFTKEQLVNLAVFLMETKSQDWIKVDNYLKQQFKD